MKRKQNRILGRHSSSSAQYTLFSSPQTSIWPSIGQNVVQRVLRSSISSMTHKPLKALKERDRMRRECHKIPFERWFPMQKKHVLKIKINQGNFANIVQELLMIIFFSLQPWLRNDQVVNC
jgi:hypothetical protein